MVCGDGRRPAPTSLSELCDDSNQAKGMTVVTTCLGVGHPPRWGSHHEGTGISGWTKIAKKVWCEESYT